MAHAARDIQSRMDPCGHGAGALVHEVRLGTVGRLHGQCAGDRQALAESTGGIRCGAAEGGMPHEDRARASAPGMRRGGGFDRLQARDRTLIERPAFARETRSHEAVRGGSAGRRPRLHQQQDRPQPRQVDHLSHGIARLAEPEAAAHGPQPLGHRDQAADPEAAEERQARCIHHDRVGTGPHEFIHARGEGVGPCRIEPSIHDHARRATLVVDLDPHQRTLRSTCEANGSGTTTPSRSARASFTSRRLVRGSSMGIPAGSAPRRIATAFSAPCTPIRW